MDALSFLFYIIATVIVLSALSVILSKNPLHSALFLVITMVSLAFIFFLLKAPFLAGVQLVVYAGAVMVLFVMVLMLFDLKPRAGEENKIFTGSSFSRLLKVVAVAWLGGLILGVIYMSMGMTSSNSPAFTLALEEDIGNSSVKALGRTLFTEYVFAFEALGLLLLFIAIGVVAMARMKGGTHAKS